MVRLVSAWFLVNGLILAPLWIPATVHGAPLAWMSVEATVFIWAMALLPRRRWRRALAWLVAASLVALALALFANLVFEQALGRPLDLSLDLYLLDAVYRLAVGNLGLAGTLLWGAAIVAVSVGLVGGIGWLLAPRAQEGSGPRPLERRLAGGVAMGALAAGLAGMVVPAVGVRFPAPAAAFLRRQGQQLVARRAEREAFLAELSADASLPTAGGLERLAGGDVVLGYIESYGMAALQDSQFGSVVRPLLESVHTRLDSAGVHLATGRLVSPTTGGQSWYAHGTMLSGLWLENQLRYELLLTSARTTLVDDFRSAGYRTATVMPAITTGWPEAVRIGYDEIHTSQNMSYAGPPFYWVTMPDQFTWSFIAGLLEARNEPLFVESGMVSSHAPWTPVVPLVDWATIGDGRAFEPYRLDGYPPEEIWWDVGLLRTYYARSIAYSLEAMAQFAERYLDERALLIVAGDHQAAPWVTGTSEPDVPVHVMSRDEALLEPFLDLGFARGPFPESASPAHRMDEFRAWFLQAYGGAS
jgi:hypothetical protein